ncbi:P-II family nitrogen regulator [Erysipelothrix sp. P66]|uniref:P-II family nitrogen regulator n=1 Tax=Erysipelothrix sp. P66 TaxID=3141531 RepID=UPI00315DD108
MPFQISNLIMVCSIVERERGSHILSISREVGATGGTVFQGRGCVRDRLLNLLGIEERRKEVCLTIMPELLEKDFYDHIQKHTNFKKPDSGVIFSVPLKSVLGIQKLPSHIKTLKEGERNVGIDAIFIIVDDGFAQDVMHVAKEHGATGGTIIHARGSGTHEHEKLFNMDIEPEKEVILILSQMDMTDAIVHALNTSFEIDKPGHGVIFVVETSRTLGLLDQE